MKLNNKVPIILTIVFLITFLPIVLIHIVHGYEIGIRLLGKTVFLCSVTGLLLALGIYPTRKLIAHIKLSHANLWAYFYKTVGVASSISIFIFLLLPFLHSEYLYLVGKEQLQLVEDKVSDVGGGLPGLLFDSRVYLEQTSYDQSYRFPYPDFLQVGKKYRFYLLPQSRTIVRAEAL